MSLNNDLAAAVAGAASVVVGLTTKRFFPYAGGIYLKRPVSRRLGAGLFLFVGGVLLIFGLARLITDLRNP
jgi:hypothetical protein